MAIDWQQVAVLDPGVRYEVIRSLVFPDLGGVEVAFVRVHPNGREEGEEGYGTIVSDNSFYCEEREGTLMRVIRFGSELEKWCRKAESRALAQWAAEFRHLNAKRWAGMEEKEIALDIAQRVWEGEWLGQREQGILYAQGLAKLMGLPNPDSFGEDNGIWAILDQLRVEERIDLDGAIVRKYTPRFRLPDQIRALISYIVEEPLGWPNGDAGAITVAQMESAIAAGTRFEHGVDLVGKENFPSLAPRLLLLAGLGWVGQAVAEAERQGWHGVMERDPESVVRALEKLIVRLKSLPEESRT